MTPSRQTGSVRHGLVRWAALALVVSLRGDTTPSLSDHLRQDLWDRVIAAGERDFAGRLGHGFPHVPRRPATRAVEPSDRGRLAQLRVWTATLIPRLDNSSQTSDAAGVAYLLAGNTTSALERLAAATEKSNDAETWNDLSAVLLEVCDRDPQRCVDAIAAADQALARGGSESVARFNRAAAMDASASFARLARNGSVPRRRQRGQPGRWKRRPTPRDSRSRNLRTHALMR